MEVKALQFEAIMSTGIVGALLSKPPEAFCLLAFAHGAGADMRNFFMVNVSAELARLGIATLRFQFPYSQKKVWRPGPPAVLTATIRSAVALAEEVRDIVFFGFPLHPAGTPSTERAVHLSSVNVPMLFLQGTRDALAGLSLLQPICKSLGERATLVAIDQVDHSFNVPKRTGRSSADIQARLAVDVADWARPLAGCR